MKTSPSRNHLPLHALAFTLTELVITIGLLALLAALVIPVAGSMRERSNTQQCANRLRQSGLLIQAYMADSNNVLRIYYGGDHAADLWTRKLVNKGYITKPEGGKVFRCPTGKTNPAKPTNESMGGEGWLYECYGIVAMDESAMAWSDRASPFTRWVTLYLSKVKTPAAFPLMADSATFSTGRQFHRIGHKLNNGDSSFALRHQETANVFFLDGHMDAVDLAKAKDLNIPDSYLQIQK